MEITSNAMRTLEDRFQKLFNNDWAIAQENAWWDQLATEKPSGGKTEIYQFLMTTFSLKALPNGQMVYSNLVTQAFEATNEKRGGGIELDAADIADDEFEFAADWAGQAGSAIALAPQDLITDLILAGETANGYDGVPFFSDAHPINPAVNGSDTYDNLVTGAALSTSTFAAGVGLMKSYKMPNGKNRNLRPSLLVVPPSLEKVGLEITQARFISATDNLLATSNGIGLLVIPELEDEPGSWYLASQAPKAGTGINPFIYQLRQPYAMKSFTNMDDARLSEIDKFQWHIRGRDAAVYGHPFQMIKFKA